MNNYVSAIASTLHGKRAGAGYLCNCPAHDDRNASLSVTPGRKHPVVVRCHAGCAQPAIIAALRDLRLWPDEPTDWTPKPSRLVPPSTEARAIAPVPESAQPPPDEHPTLGPPDHVYPYRDAQGRLLQLVYRWDATPARRGRKEIRPLCYTSEGWAWEQRLQPRPLYGLDLLAANPQRPVVVVEGEKATHAARTALADTHVVMTWSGGGQVTHADLSPLTGRDVTVWPDNDDAGRREADVILSRVAGARLVELPPDLPPKADAADLSPEQIRALVQHTTQPDTVWDWVTPVGHHNGRRVYFCRTTGDLRILSPSQHDKRTLPGLVPAQQLWERTFPGAKTRIDWDAAACELMARADAAGAWTPARERGRGAHPGIVLHLGDRVHPLGRPGVYGEHVYASAPALPNPLDVEPMGDDEAENILSLLSSLSWASPAAAQLLAGWIALAPLCGALPWRPHLWLTARKGAGKSVTLDQFVRPLTAGYAVTITGETTEAGIRQTLRADALPVVYDEAEGDDPAGQMRIRRLIDFIRQSSSGGIVRKGTGTQSGAIAYLCRSAFCLASIAAPNLKAADESRITHLALGNPLPAAQWRPLAARIRAAVTPQAGLRLLARVLHAWPAVEANMATLRAVAGDALGSQRLGDQYGTLGAGYAAWLSTSTLTDRQASALLTSLNLPTTADAGDDDDVVCLQALMQSRVRDGHNQERAIGELVEDARDPHSAAHDTLRRHGVRVEADCIAVATRHTALAQHLAHTPWADRWGTLLARLPGARAGRDVKPRRFAGQYLRVVEIPLPIRHQSS